MNAQFRFFGNSAIADGKRPILAGLNYFLTHEARGGSSKKLLGEKRMSKSGWDGWSAGPTVMWTPSKHPLDSYPATTIKGAF
jgi:hypothetical protein